MEKRSFPMSAAGRKDGKVGEDRMVEGVVEVVGRTGVCPSLGGQQEQGIPGKQEPRGAFVPSHPGGRLRNKNIINITAGILTCF